MTAQPPAGAIAARMIARTVALCERRGFDIGPLCRAAGIHPSTLADPEARIPYAAVALLSEGVYALTGDENFGLHLAQDVADAGAAPDAGLLFLMASPDVRTALMRMAERQRYWGDGQRVSLHEAEGGLWLRYALPHAEGAHARHADECMLAEITLGVRLLSGAPLAPVRVCFRHRAPRDTREHAALFAAPLAFSAPFTGLMFDDAALDHPLQHAHAAFCAIFAQQVDRAIARLPAPSSSSAAVRAVVHAALASGQCSLDSSARALGVSARTLQRRLHEEGTSFAEVVTALRRELAEAYLARGISVPEVASLLGYADASAFHHAFRRWSGTSPGRFQADESER